MYGNSKGVASGSEIYKATLDLTTGIDQQPFADPYPKLFQNLPNPFKDQTRINFELPESGFTTLSLFDMAGNTVRTFVNGILNSGKHSILVNREKLSPGIYYYMLNSGNNVQTKKLVIN